MLHFYEKTRIEKERTYPATLRSGAQPPQFTGRAVPSGMRLEAALEAAGE
jgi:hypothetical protein